LAARLRSLCSRGRSLSGHLSMRCRRAQRRQRIRPARAPRPPPQPPETTSHTTPNHAAAPFNGTNVPCLQTKLGRAAFLKT
jgi:hypothetical protein